jgi:hypothetical protein
MGSSERKGHKLMFARDLDGNGIGVLVPVKARSGEDFH